MVLEVTAFADPPSHSHPHGAAAQHSSSTVPNFKNNDSIKNCYDCLHKAKSDYTLRKPKFLERYSTWNEFLEKSVRFFDPKIDTDRDSWASKILSKYNDGGKTCPSQCPPKLQQSLPPSFLVSLERLRTGSKNRISSFLL